MSTSNPTATDFVNALSPIQEYDNDSYTDCLHNKTRQCSNISVFKPWLNSLPSFGSPSTQFTIAGWDATDTLELLAEASAANGLSNVSSSVDIYDMRACANDTTATNTISACIDTATKYLYRDYINALLSAASPPVPDLDTLKNQSGFGSDLATKMNSTHFHSQAVNKDKSLGGQNTYTGALLRALNYLDPAAYQSLNSNWAETKTDVEDGWSSITAANGTSAFEPIITQSAPSCTTTVGIPDPNSGGGGGSCFIAGTLIATNNGLTNIEDIAGGSQVLTNAVPVTYGIASDEDVVQPMTNVPFLCGFNNEGAFFTPGHVFHTTTGLRAVDPELAREENNWLEVGPLRAGHVVYRLASDGNGYELTPIKSVQVVEPGKGQAAVYGVHLREGYRNYHANGYLVRVNYPEITIKSIARQLSAVPEKERVKMLGHIRELQPLFERFGASTMADVLGRELRGQYRRKHLTSSSPKRRTACLLRRATRHYTLHETSNTNAHDYKLPALKINQGTVLLDGQPQSRGVIDADDQTIRWTRAIPGHGYEHGYVRMNDHGLAGSGCVVLSTDPSLAAIPMDSALKCVRFVATNPSANVDAASDGSPKKVATSAKNRLTLPPNYDPWPMVLDKSVWPVNEPRKLPKEPTEFGEIAFATYQTNGKVGMFFTTLIVPVLDELCKVINAKYLPADQQLDSLYQAYMTLNNEGLQMGMINLTEADLLNELADKPKDGSSFSKLNVSFRDSLDTDIKLPILFKTMGLQVNSDFTEVTGCATEFDAEMRGGDGNRHLLLSDEEAGRPNLSQSLAMGGIQSSKDSHHLPSTGQTPWTIMRSMETSPAPVTNALLAETPLSVGDLTTLTNYNSVKVHDSSQTLLQNTMLYHMNEDQRLNFLQVSVPRDLPDSLGKNLPQNIKDWIRDTYGPAYVTYVLSQIQTKDTDWRYPLTEEEKKKIHYFWTGSGKTCLSKSQHYNRLNALCSTEAMRLLHKKTLQRYLDAGGKTWADKLLKESTKNKHAMSQLAMNPGSDVSNISKYCNILNALDPDGDQANGMFDAIASYAIKQQLEDPYWPINKEDIESNRKWLEDAFGSFIIQVLTNDSSLDPKIRQSLMDDLKKLAEDLGISLDQQAKVVAEQIVKQTALLTSNVALAMSTIIGGVQAAGKLAGFKSAPAVVNTALNAMDRNKGKVIALKGMMTLVVVGFYTWSAYNTFASWDQLDKPAQAIAVLTVMSMATDIAGKAISLYENEIKPWRATRNGNALMLTPGEATAGAALNREASLITDDGRLELTLEEVNQESPLLVARRNYTKYGAATTKVDLVAGSPSEIAPGEKLTQSEKPTIPEDVAPPSEGGYQKMSKAVRILNVINIGIGIGMTVAMAFDLKNHWDDYTDLGKALNIIQVIAQGLSVLVDAAVLAADLAVSAGLLAATSTMLVVLPIIGAVIALIGIAVMIILLFVNGTKPKDPPNTPVEDFLQDIAHPTIQKWDSPPPISLTYDVPKEVRGDTDTTFTIKATNNQSQAVNLNMSKITFDVGTEDSCLFKDPTSWKSAVDVKKLTAGEAGVTPETLGTCIVEKTPQNETHDEWNTKVKGAFVKATSEGENTHFKLDPGQSVLIEFLGKINKAGSTVLNIVEYLTNGDNCRYQAEIKRT